MFAAINPLRCRALGRLAVLAGVATITAIAPGAAEASRSACRLNGPYKHVIYVQFDNTHLTRDNPNVPADLEQMPHLLNFLRGNGTVMNKHGADLAYRRRDHELTDRPVSRPDGHHRVELL